jgi:putative FmdB family regulatory protein
MPLFEYRCNVCHARSELLLLTQAAAACPRCGSPDMAKLVSRFSFKAARPAKYSEDFREKALPFLKSRPGAAELLSEGGESEEARAFRLTEHIGQRVDAALEGM